MLPLLEVRDLKKHFPIRGGLMNKIVNYLRAVDGVSFQIMPGETFGLVGESGCGKTTTGRSILRLEQPTSGEVMFEGHSLASLSREEMRKQRRQMQMVFQDPYGSLNPRLRILDILTEPLQAHGVGTSNDRKQLVAEILGRVGLNRDQMYRYPHEFSGGQRQRIGIARALVLNPKLIVLDEPVSALDVSIQSQILNLLLDLQREFSLTYLFIAHDLSVIAHLCDRVGVMYLGGLVEVAPVETLYSEPLHPYTRSLLHAIPEPDPRRRRSGQLLQGDVPSAIDPPEGCRFHTRCPQAMDVCRKKQPALLSHPTGGQVACHLYSTANTD